MPEGEGCEGKEGLEIFLGGHLGGIVQDGLKSLTAAGYYGGAYVQEAIFGEVAVGVGGRGMGLGVELEELFGQNVLEQENVADGVFS